MKIHQISKILAAKSVDGLAPFSIYSDLVIYIVNAVYHVVSGSPFRCVPFAWKRSNIKCVLSCNDGAAAERQVFYRFAIL